MASRSGRLVGIRHGCPTTRSCHHDNAAWSHRQKPSKPPLDSNQADKSPDD
jgi:hypothetical protein